MLGMLTIILEKKITEQSLDKTGDKVWNRSI